MVPGPNDVHQMLELTRMRQQEIRSEADAYRRLSYGRPSAPPPWRKLRMSAGDLLIHAGIWLKTGALTSSSSSLPS